MTGLTLRVCTLYPDLMNIYADRGNMIFLERRCRDRGIGFEITPLGVGERVDPDRHDLFYIGGGQDRDQALVAEDLVATKRDDLANATSAGAVLLAVCGGLQLLGESYEMEDRTLPGLGLAHLHTVREGNKRLIGNIEIEVDLGNGAQVLAGFENHGGRTYLNQAERPLGRVVSGHGNNGRDHTEGVWRDNIFGTYLHGPLLPKNVWFADHLVALALRRRAGYPVELAPLDDRIEADAHLSARAAARRDARRHNRLNRLRKAG